jgi:hypothetical protein
MIAMIIIATILFADVSTAETYYVAPNGNDNNPGAFDRPWHSIQAAANRLVAGDTLLIREGNYEEKIVIRRGGDRGHPITYKAYPGEAPVLNGANLNIEKWSGIIEIDGADFIKLEGLEIANSAYRGISIINDAIHLTLINLDIHNNGAEAGILVEGAASPAYSIIKGCKIYNNTRSGIALWTATGGYWLIEENVVYGNLGKDNWDGIQVGGYNAASHHVVVRNNVVYDNGGEGADQIDMGGHSRASYYLMEGNEVYGNIGWKNVKLSGQGQEYSIQRFNRLTNQTLVYYSLQPYRVATYNNTVHNAHHDVLWSGEGETPDASFQGWVFKNNLFTSNSGPPFVCTGKCPIDQSVSSMFFDGNMYLFGQDYIYWGNDQYSTHAKGFTLWRSDWGQEPRGKRIHCAITDIYTDASKRTYTLRLGSPAIDAGVALTYTITSGKGTTVDVEKSWYFQDGYNGLIEPDFIRVGHNPPVRISSIQHSKNRITVEQPIEWKKGDFVNLPYNGDSPDVGAYEH